MTKTHDETMAYLNEKDAKGFNGTCGIVCLEASPEHAISEMTIHEGLFQPFGFVHGGATLTLLEAVASRCTDLRADMETERPFGINVNVWHKKPGISGKLTGYANLAKEEISANGSGRKQFWDVKAVDDSGDICSEGVVITKIVKKEYLEKKNAERAAKK